jgi:hypothetical protein
VAVVPTERNGGWAGDGVVDVPTRDKGNYESTYIHQYRLKKVGDFLGPYYSTISAIAERVAEGEALRYKT